MSEVSVMDLFVSSYCSFLTIGMDASSLSLPCMQFLTGGIREFDDVGKSGFQTAVCLQEVLHFLGVTGQDDDQVVTMVFHRLD